MTDTDGDGIPDVADFNTLNTGDADGDGIDNSADVDFLGGTDTDGDGIDDSVDPDANGDGLADALNGANAEATPIGNHSSKYRYE